MIVLGIVNNAGVLARSAAQSMKQHGMNLT